MQYDSRNQNTASCTALYLFIKVFFLKFMILKTHPSYLQELESVSGWISSVPDGAAAAASSSNPTCAPRSGTGCGAGTSPEGSILVPGRERRRGGGETQDSAAVELLHSGWLKDRGQEFPVAPTAAPPELIRFPVVSANFLLPPLP